MADRITIVPTTVLPIILLFDVFVNYLIIIRESVSAYYVELK